MLAFESMLIAAAEKAGIKVPLDTDYDPHEYPHWRVFCTMQLGRSMPTPTAHWDNAKIIAAIPDDKIKTVNTVDILGMGYA